MPFLQGKTCYAVWTSRNLVVCFVTKKWNPLLTFFSDAKLLKLFGFLLARVSSQILSKQHPLLTLSRLS